MSGSVPPSPPSLMTLQGLRVVLIGRFVRLSRGEWVRRLQSLGASIGREVTPAVQLVVIGDGPWPVRKNGRMPRGLLVARILQLRQASPEVITETMLAQRDSHWSETFPHMTPLKEHPHHSCDGTDARPATIGYQDWQRARVLVHLMATGVSRRRLQRALYQLGRWFPEARTDWERFSPTWDGRGLLFQTPRGLVEANGQRVLEEALEDDAAPCTMPLRTAAEQDLFALAVDHELGGDFPAAERVYRSLLLKEGPDADVCFNLANVLVAMNQRRAAMERLWQCVELAPRFSEAWHNLGTVALELSEGETALQAFQQALELVPNFHAAQLGSQAARQLCSAR